MHLAAAGELVFTENASIGGKSGEMAASCARRLCFMRFSTGLVKNASNSAFYNVPRLPAYPRLDNSARHNRFVISKRNYCSASQGGEPGTQEN